MISGSSPRVRGTGRVVRPEGYLRRFIPARAGNGSVRSSTSNQNGGSSPRVRGTDRSGKQIIPAEGPVHPRACGERDPDGADTEGTLGSSPRVRGTERKLTRTGSQPTVHPRACGERLELNCKRWQYTGSSPRVRGTDAGRHHHQESFGGSSPRVRGTGLDQMAKDRVGRFIPARAGNGLDVMLFIICDLHAG